MGVQDQLEVLEQLDNRDGLVGGVEEIEMDIG